MSALKTALAALKFSISVIPCNTENKRPLVSWEKFQSDLPTKDEIRSWWSQWPDAALGIITGDISGLVVVDVDSADPLHLKTALEEFGETPRIVRTPRGGAHLYYRHTGVEVRNTVKLPGFDFSADIRGDGGYVMAPPSPGYVLERTGRLEELPAFPHERLAELLKRKPNGDAGDGLHASEPREWSEGAEAGNRNDTLAKLVGTMLKAGTRREWVELAAMEFARRCTPPMDPREVRRTIESICKRHARNHPEGDTEPDDSPILLRIADVEPETVEWLVEPYLPLGKLALTEGDPGNGKTWLMLALAAAVSKGFGLPIGHSSAPGNVLYLTAEDGIGDTLRPRLDSMGAELSRVVVLDGIATEAGRREVTLADLSVIGAALEQVKPALVVIDPIQGFLGAGVDMHRANEVRPLLAGLGRLAAEHRAAIVAIRHLRKSASDRATHRGLGSIDFSAAVRSILLVAEDPDDPARRIVAHAKSNLAALGASLAFGIQDGCFEWLGTSSLGADDLLRAREPAQERASREEAEEFLESALAAGPVSSDDLRKTAKAAGISWSTLRRAKDALGVIARREGYGPEGRWLWQLPSEPVG